MKKIILVLCLCVAMINSAICVSAVEIVGDLYYAESGFYLVGGNSETVLDTICSGDVRSRYLVVNNESSSKEVTVAAGLYENDALIQIEFSTKMIEPGMTGVFENVYNVPAGASAYSIQVFVLEDLNAGIPLTRVMALSSKSNRAEVISFSLDGAAAAVDNLTKRIDAVVPYGTNLTSCTASAVVSAGAEYTLSSTDFSDVVVMEVTAANGVSSVYKIYTSIALPESADAHIDFENAAVGDTLPSGITMSGTSYGSLSITKDPKDANNTVLYVEDTSSEGMVYAYYSFDPIYYPFRVDYKIMFGHKDEYSVVDNVNYCIATVNSKKSIDNCIAGLGVHGETATSNPKWLYRAGKADGSYQDIGVPSSPTMSMDEWYDITMVYRSDRMVEYYVDGKLILTAEPRSAEDSCSLFWFSSSKSRTSYTYIDDVKIAHIAEETNDAGYTQDFDSMTTGEGPSDSWTFPKTEGGGATEFTDDFESNKANVGLGVLPMGWEMNTINYGTATVEQDPEDPSNTVLKVVDRGNGSSDAVYVYRSFDEVSFPFTTEYRVRYSVEGDYTSDGNGKNNAGWDVVTIGTGRNIKDNNIAGLMPGNGNPPGWIYRARNESNSTGYSDTSISGTQLQYDKWYYVKMDYCLAENGTDRVVKYYASDDPDTVDDNLLITAPAVSDHDVGSFLWYSSSTSRTSVAYLDDFKVIHDSSNDIPVGAVTIENGNNGKVLDIYSSYAERKFNATKNGIDLTFDICLDSESLTGQAASVKAGENALSFYDIGDGSYSIDLKNGVGCTIDNILLKPDTWYQLRLSSFVSEPTGKPVTAVYLDGRLIYAAAASLSELTADSVTFTADSGRRLLIDNVAIKDF